MEISITRALSELKLLDKRINTAIQSSEFAGMAVGKKPVQGYFSDEDFNTRVQANWDSVNALIARRDAIKSAITLSNATQEVVVNGVTMTVAKAIDMKNSIGYKKLLLQKMKNDYTTVLVAVSRKNQDVDNKLEQQLAVLYGRDAKVTDTEREMVTKPYREEHEAKFHDPIKLRDKIEALESEIVGFESEVDFVLSESNTITKIVVPD